MTTFVLQKTTLFQSQFRSVILNMTQMLKTLFAPSTEQQTIKALNALSDRELADIGIERHDIAKFVRD